MSAPGDSAGYTVTLFRDRSAQTHLEQHTIPLVHIDTARKLAFDWARTRHGSFLRLDAVYGHLEEWERKDGWWNPILVPPLEAERVEPTPAS